MKFFAYASILGLEIYYLRVPGYDEATRRIMLSELFYLYISKAKSGFVVLMSKKKRLYNGPYLSKGTCVFL